MEKMRFDEFDNPIFRVPDITLPSPEKIPRGLPEGCIPKYRHLVRQYDLLDDLWNVQLGDEWDRTPWNLKAASAFWRDNLPDTFEGRRFGYTENWIADAMRKTKDQIDRMRLVAHIRSLDAFIDEIVRRREAKYVGDSKGEERGRSLKKSKRTPGHSPLSKDGSNNQCRDSSPAQSPSLRFELRPAGNLTDDDLSASTSKPCSLSKTALEVQVVDDDDGAVTQGDEPLNRPVVLSKI